jgi:putative endonuclease
MGIPPKDRVREGRQAEDVACRFLAAHGYEILERNVYLPGGELDIVARMGATLVFVEVRSRRAGSRFSAAASVDRRKREHLQRAAAEYLRRRGLSCARCRFDVVVLSRGREGWRLRLYPAAFVDED